MRAQRLICIFVLSLIVLSGTGSQGQQVQTFAWSSKNCPTCESSILNPGWYSDGSGLFTELISGNTADATASMALTEGNFVVAVGFGIEKGSLTVKPRESVILESDSAPHMILYPLAHPDPKIPKGDVSRKKQFNDKSVTLGIGGVTAGYLFFPDDPNASHITVVVQVGNETFRFPFARNPSARAKFGDPDAIPAGKAAQERVASNSSKSGGGVASVAPPSVASGASLSPGLNPPGQRPAVAETTSALVNQTSAVGSESQLQECQRQVDTEVFPTDTCAVIVGYLAPTDKLGLGPYEDGSFMVLSPSADGKSSLKTYYLPARLRSEIALKTVDRTVHDAQSFAEKEPNGIFAGMLPDGRKLWFNLLDVYCYYHPDEQYADLSGNMARCPREESLPDDKILETYFDGAMVYKTNYLTFLDARVAERMDSKSPTAHPMSATQSGAPAAATPIPNERASQSFARTDQLNCRKNISFAVATNGNIASLIPDFAQKWISKNQKKYAGLCFSQEPDSKAANYLLVFSTSQSAFNGIYPIVKTSTNTNTSATPVSGSGTVTDNYGGMWNYTYDGTVTTTTTTTTTTHDELPYTDTSNTLYLRSYDQNGRVISERWRTITTRQGGDGANTLGYNLGAALGAIHMKQHLLKNVVEDVTKGTK